MKKTNLVPGKIIFAPIGDANNNELTKEGRAEAKTKRHILEELLKGNKTATILFDRRHNASVEAVDIMTSNLPHVIKAGADVHELSTVGLVSKDGILSFMSDHTEVEALIVVGTLLATRQMPNYWAEAHNIEPFHVELLGTDELCVLTPSARTLHISTAEYVS